VRFLGRFVFYQTVKSLVKAPADEEGSSELAVDNYL
jgi:hypothetical protein